MMSTPKGLNRVLAVLQANQEAITKGFIQEGIIYVLNHKGAGAKWVRAAGADAARFGEARPLCLGTTAGLDDKEGIR